MKRKVIFASLRTWIHLSVPRDWTDGYLLVVLGFSIGKEKGMISKNWEGVWSRAIARPWWLMALLAPAAAWIALASSANGHNYLSGCKTGCDSLSCVVDQSGKTAQGWYYINGSCYWTWVSQNADPNKQPDNIPMGNQRKPASWDDNCFGTVQWGAGTGCQASGDPVNVSCNSGCIAIPSSSASGI